MKNIIRISGAILLLFLFYSCKKEIVPTLTTSEIINITGTTASGGGTITDEGSGTVMARGVCWSTDITPTINDNKTSDGAGAGSFTSSITGLNGGTEYYVRAYATNSTGTGYGMAMSFTTLGQLPIASISEARNIDTASVTFQGYVNANYLSTEVIFEYGPTTNYGGIISATQSPVTGNTNTEVSSIVTGLSSGALYHYRMKTVNSLGTTYSIDLTFNTLGHAPTVNILAATNITTAAAQLNGTVNANYLYTIVTFEYGTTISYGSFVTPSQSPVIGNTKTNVSALINGLTGGTIYHYRVKAVNSLGVIYGDDWTFTLSSYGAATDVEGNIYDTIAIGTQVWMKENLKTTKYSNGDLIGTTTPATLDITIEGTPKYQWAYDGNESNVTIYGRLYTWYAVTDIRNICPTGWHVPTNEDWTTLQTFIGGNFAGGKLKEAGTSHWVSPNTGATNETGFTALPAGNRHGVANTFMNIGQYCFWWSSTTNTGWSQSYNWSTFDGNGSYPNTSGFSPL